MLKRYSALWEFVLVCLDLLVLIASSLLSYLVAFQENAPFRKVLSAHSYPLFLLAILAVWPLLLRGFRLYHPRRTSSILQEGSDIAKATTTGVVLLVILAFFLPSLQITRSVIVYHWATSFIGLFLERATCRTLLRSARQRGYNYRRVLVVGAGNLGVKTVKAIHNNPGMGLHVVGFLDDYKPVGSSIEGTFNLGTLRDLIKVVDERNVDRVIVALPVRSHRRLYYIVEKLVDKLVDISVVPDIYQSITLNAGVAEIGGLPLLNLTDSNMYGWAAIAKRSFDIVVSLIAIILTAPLMLTIAVILKRTSPGSVLFKQWRYGADGKAIRIYKFRSMNVSEDGASVAQAKRTDERITPLGAFLRKTSMDELPQFFNVLQGRMSVVGPRPHAVAHNEQYRRLIKNYMLRHKVKPGITGWAQVNGWRGETDTLKKMEMRVNHDVFYIENWSIWLDVKILFLTIWNGFKHENAY